MATPPTFIAEYESNFLNSTAPETASVTVGVGDQLAVVAATADSSTTLTTPTGGGLVYTLAQSIEIIGDWCAGYGWTAPSATSQTYTVSVGSNGGGNLYGLNVVRFNGSDGIGASAKTNVNPGAPSLNLTTVADNSAIVVVAADWNAVDGASRTWRSVNGITPSVGNGFELTYQRDGAQYTVYAAYYPDAGAAGLKTVGLSAPSGQAYSIVAVEVKGVASGPLATPAPAVVPPPAVVRGACW